MGPHTEDAETPDARRFAPAAQRNREPIAGALEEILPQSARILEIASGTGEHAVFFADRFPDWRWIASDPDPDSRASIAAWVAFTSLSNVDGPLSVDVTATDWHASFSEKFDAVLAINLVHISPKTALYGLFAGAAQLLAPEATLVLYGPFQRNGRHTAPSNEAFDESLRARNPDWGVRDLESDILPVAARHDFSCTHINTMPANNFFVVFSKR